MAEHDIHQPHDKLFKSGFREPANAAAFLRAEIPAKLSARIDWEKLRLESGEFVDSQLRGSQSDLLFSAPWEDRRCFLYLLFEHHCAVDRWVALQLLRYKVRIWEKHRREHPRDEKLPVILPVVLAQQGSEHWEEFAQFSSLLDMPPEAAPYVPDFRFHLVQLDRMPYREIPGTPAGILVLRALKAAITGELLGEELWDEALMREAMPMCEVILRYILSRDDIDSGRFADRVRTLSDAGIQEKAMTLADQIRQEGRQEGRISTLQRAVIEVLEIRFERVPEGLRIEIEQIADSARLDGLHRAAIQCADIEAFSSAL